MTRIFTKPSALVPACDYVDGGGNGGGGRGVTCASINVMCRKRELERIALENKHLVSYRCGVLIALCTHAKKNADGLYILFRLSTLKQLYLFIWCKGYGSLCSARVKPEQTAVQGKRAACNYSHVSQCHSGPEVLN